MNKLIIFILLFTFTLGDKEGSNGSMSINMITPNHTNYTTKSINRSTTDKNVLNFDLKMIIPFLLGMICSTLIFSVVFCFVIICNRCRTTDANTEKESVILEAINSEHEQLLMQSDVDQADEQTPLQVQATVEVSTNPSATNFATEEEVKILKKEDSEGAEEVTEVNYASINYSLLQKKDEDLQPQIMESDYAEIQLQNKSEDKEIETLKDAVKQDEVKQNGVDQGLDGEMETQKQVKLDEVQV